jgi:hypothetical protein
MTKYNEEHGWAHDLYGQLIGFEIVDFLHGRIRFRRRGV